MDTESNTLDVGSVVRVPWAQMPRSKGKATVATMQDDETACILWDSTAPKPLSIVFNEKKKRRLQKSFLVTPCIKDSEKDGGKETNVPISDLIPLLEFEKQPKDNGTVGPEDEKQDIAIWKGRGDQLLKIGDASAACSYYEIALKLSSILQVGSSVIVKQGGFLKVAEVDCIDGDDIEISMRESDEEKVIKEKDIILCILFDDADDHTQERILLNLARCLRQLAELSKQQEMTSDWRSQFLKSAVLATTLAMAIAEYHKEDEEAPFTSLEQTALLLRSQAQASLAKFQHALGDIKKLLNDHPQHKEGLKQLQSLQMQQQRKKIVDKKLVKSMCKWVKTAADSDPVSEEDRTMSAQRNVITEDGQIVSRCQPLRPTWILMYILVPLLLAFLLQTLLG